MNKKLKNYVVSSAGWEIEVDEFDEESAATSALIIALKRYHKNLEMSTIIMINQKQDHTNNILVRAQFIPTHKIFKKLGLEDLSRHFSEFLSLNES